MRAAVVLLALLSMTVDGGGTPAALYDFSTGGTRPDLELYGYISQVDLEDEYIDMPDSEDSTSDEDGALYGHFEVHRRGYWHHHALQRARSEAPAP